MSKTRLVQSKEQLVAIVTVSVMVLVFIANAIILTTSMISVYLNDSVSQGAAPIDTKTVTEAIKILSE